MKVTKYVCGGDTRCLQAAFRMVVWAFIGSDPGELAADELTGYVEGRGTWQFRMLLAFGKYGLNALDYEDFDVVEFVTDPEKAIRKQVQDEQAVADIVNETDMNLETQAARECLESSHVRFRKEAPLFDDLISEIRRDRLVIVSVNLKILQGKPGREGHMFIVEYIDDDFVVAHDPGPRGGLEVKIPRKLFELAWTSPSESMANYISVWPSLSSSPG